MDYQTLQPTGFQRLTALFVLAASTLVIAAVARPPNRYAWLANGPNNTYDNATLAGIREIANLTGTVVDPFYAGIDPVTQLGHCQQAIGSGLYSGIFVESDDVQIRHRALCRRGAHETHSGCRDRPSHRTGSDDCAAAGSGGSRRQFSSRVPLGYRSYQHPAASLPGIGHLPRFLFRRRCFARTRHARNPGNPKTAAAANPAVVLTVVDQAFYDTPTAKQVAMRRSCKPTPEINMAVAHAA